MSYIIRYIIEEEEQGVESCADHEGRVRSFPHVRGNWATHVYVPIHLSDDVITGLTSFGKKLNKYFRLVRTLSFLIIINKHL
jgi:hypothetical protein